MCRQIHPDFRALSLVIHTLGKGEVIFVSSGVDSYCGAKVLIYF